MPRVLVTEQLAEPALDALRAAGHEVDVRLGLSGPELKDAIRGAAALIVRSATQVTEDVLAAADELVVVGRAGAGVDNIDVDAATRRGVMVANAPGSNALSTAEHTIALLLAQARNIPQAHSALKAGRWEKSKWEGVELHGKTLGVIGIGRIGTLVAQRAHAFGMRIVAWDPWVTEERARQLGVELVALPDLVAQADFVTIHLAMTKEYVGIIGEELLAKAKSGIRVINAARGGLIDMDALDRALADGTVGGAAIDVFEVEPCTDAPIFKYDQVVVTPHLAASTPEAQDKAGLMIAEQVRLALAGDFVPFAINVSAAEASETVRPFLPLAERLGQVYAALNEGVPAVLDIEYQGELGGVDTRILTLAVLKGVFAAAGEEAVSYVNAPHLAEERGVEVRETSSTSAHDYVNLLTVRGGGHALAGTLYGLRGEARIVMVDDHTVEFPFAPNLLVVRNDDRVGMMAKVTSTVAEAGVNIAQMSLGRSPQGSTALAVITSDQPFPAEVRDRLMGEPGILEVSVVNAT